MSDIEEALDAMLGKWGLSTEDGPVMSRSDAMSDLVSDVLMVIRQSRLADDVAAFIDRRLQ